MLREADELGHRAEVLIEVVELICARARTGGEAGKTVQRAINATIVGEIHQVGAGSWDRVCDSVLVGMNVSERAERVAAINVGEIQERRGGAGGIEGADRTLI